MADRMGLSGTEEMVGAGSGCVGVAGWLSVTFLAAVFTGFGTLLGARLGSNFRSVFFGMAFLGSGFGTGPESFFDFSVFSSWGIGGSACEVIGAGSSERVSNIANVREMGASPSGSSAGSTNDKIRADTIPLCQDSCRLSEITKESAVGRKVRINDPVS